MSATYSTHLEVKRLKDIKMEEKKRTQRMRIKEDKGRLKEDKKEDSR